jgi:hypothetical protein
MAALSRGIDAGGRGVVDMIRKRRPFCIFVAAAVACGAADVAWAADWVSVAKSDRTEVFVNTLSLGHVGEWISVRTKQNFTEPQPALKKGKSYLSARNEYRVDCAQRRLAYREIRAFEQPELQGAEVQKTKVGEKNLKWMDAPENTVFGELLDYACEHAPAAPPAAP